MGWDLVTRAALWSAPSSTDPWTRLATLRNGSHMFTVCNGIKAVPSFVTWAPTLNRAPSSVNASRKDVWNVFTCPIKTATTATMPSTMRATVLATQAYPLLTTQNNSAFPPGAEGVVNVAVNGSHSFSA